MKEPKPLRTEYGIGHRLESCVLTNTIRCNFVLLEYTKKPIQKLGEGLPRVEEA